MINLTLIFFVTTSAHDDYRSAKAPPQGQEIFFKNNQYFKIFVKEKVSFTLICILLPVFANFAQLKLLDAKGKA